MVNKLLITAFLIVFIAVGTIGGCGGGGKDENELIAILIAIFDPPKQSVETGVFDELGDGAIRDNVTYVADFENTGNIPITITKIGEARVAEGFDYSLTPLKGFVGPEDPLSGFIGMEFNPNESIEIFDVVRTAVGGDAKNGLGVFYESELGQGCEPIEVRVNTAANPKFAMFTVIGNTFMQEYDDNGFSENTINTAIRDISVLCDETLFENN